MQKVPYNRFRKYLGKKRRCIVCNSNTKNTNWAIDKYFKAIKCKKCGMISIDPGLNEEGLKEYYQNNMTRRIVQARKMKLRKKQYIIDKNFIERVVSKGKVLDVGCGGGVFLSVLDKNFNKYGIDLDNDAINFGKKQYNFNFQVVEIGNDSFSKESFDLIIFRGVIEHMYDPRKAIKRSSELLKKKGKLFFSATPNADSFAAQIFREKWNLWHPIQHINIFSPVTLEKLCNQFNFKKIDEQYPYIETPYVDLKNDYNKMRKLIKINSKNFKGFTPPFWGNMMSIIFEKN